MKDENWKIFDLKSVIKQQKGSREPYLEFLRVPSLSCGVYSLPAGATDLQGPHDEDITLLVFFASGGP